MPAGVFTNATLVCSNHLSARANRANLSLSIVRLIYSRSLSKCRQRPSPTSPGLFSRIGSCALWRSGREPAAFSRLIPRRKVLHSHRERFQKIRFRASHACFPYDSRRMSFLSGGNGYLTFDLGIQEPEPVPIAHFRSSANWPWGRYLRSLIRSGRCHHLASSRHRVCCKLPGCS